MACIGSNTLYGIHMYLNSTENGPPTGSNTLYGILIHPLAEEVRSGLTGSNTLYGIQVDVLLSTDAGAYGSNTLYGIQLRERAPLNLANSVLTPFTGFPLQNPRRLLVARGF